ncbi:MAG: ABC transporter ATP-binding protein, partial [Planctomycetes bacterium]|nr:ABC transporter ATP-binding protein [Planctomycetota bacterium]
GLLHPTRGRISVFGKPPDDVRTKTRIGYLPEESYLYRFLNARETLDYYATLFQLPRRDRNRRVDELLEMVGLKSAARRPVGEYSKGMARRIGLAQALINDPDLLILDEPTSGLDPVGAKLVKDIIIRLGREYKKTILLSSHLLADCEEVCDRVTILFGGKVQVSGGMEEVLARQDQIQITCDRLSDAAIAQIRSIIEQREGKSALIDTPKDRLESLFLRIVEQAHRQRVETAGAASAGAIAGFLGADGGGRELLEQLVKVEAEVRAETPAPATEKVDASVLSELTAPKSARESTAPGAPSKAEPDRGVLDELLGGDESKGAK